jgi:hypothetical protein
MVSRRTPVAASIFRSDHPRRPRPSTCCCVDLAKTLHMAERPVRVALPSTPQRASCDGRISDAHWWPDLGVHRGFDIGAREGCFSRLLADRIDEVVTLDLEMPRIEHDRVRCVAGDATALQFDDGSFDAVLCAEVLEHIPPPGLQRACEEIARVTCGIAVIGVPFRQDTRVGRTTCAQCGRPNPPWGHVNEFDEPRLR